MEPKFYHPSHGKRTRKDKLEKIWNDWKAFAEYLLNKSHSTCYAWIAHQPPIFVAIQQYYMAAVLSNMSDIKQVSFLWKNVNEWIASSRSTCKRKFLPPYS
jgi:DNA polymerase-3 subunit alpha